MRYLFWTSILILAAVGACFAVSNRVPVDLQFWPLPYIAAVPLFLVLFGAVILGWLVGRIGAWFVQGAGRRERRALKRQVAALETELRRLKPGLPANPPGTNRSLVA